MKIPHRNRRSVVEEVGAQTEQARGLVDITDQRLLTDPRTNPATRPHADRLRDDQQRTALTLEHRRAMRRGRVDDRRAAHAERALEALQNAREALSPARAVTILQNGRRRFLNGSLAASVALSLGSALGLAAVSEHTGGTPVAGYLAELCLTVMTTVAILYRSHIDQAATDEASSLWEGWRSRAVLALVVVPLSISVLVNLVGWAFGAPVSPINALCAVGAGAAGGFAYLVADVSARAIRSTAALVDSADEDDLRARAVGDDLFEAVPDQKGTQDAGTPQRPSAPRWERLGDGRRRRVGGTRIEGWVPLPDNPIVLPIVATDNGDTPGVTDGPDDDPEPAWVGEIEAFANRPEPPDSGLGARTGGPSDTPTGDASGAASVTRGDKGADLPNDASDDGGEATERVVSAAEAKRIEGEENRRRIGDYLVRHPGASAAEIAEAVGLTERTVKRHRKTLRGEG